MEQVAIAWAVQGIGAAISGSKEADNAYEQDVNICNDYNKTLTATAQIKALTATLTQASAKQLATNQQFLQLNDQIKAEKENIASRERKFWVKLLITIIVNIVLTSYLAIRLLL